MQQRSTRRGGFTIVELVFLIIGLTLGFVSAMAPLGHARQQARELKDSTQIRAITQASLIWAQHNQERYPIPSRFDRTGIVLPRPPDLQGPDLRLDTTGNVLSLLIFNGFVPTEDTVSPAEVGNGAVMQKYQLARPSTAVDPAMALWDPAYRGTPLDEWGGRVPGAVGDASHNSYAQVAYHGGRDHLWSNTFSATEAVWGNRGPAYTLERDQWVPLPNSPFGDGSTTNGIHGEPTSWAGNIAFNDGHVEFLTRPDPQTLAWTFPGLEDQLQRVWPDNVFHAEHDHIRAPIGEDIGFVAGRDGRGVARYTGRVGRVGPGALDQRNNYLRPIARILPGENGALEAHIWVD